jgi:hypothetical protein
MIKDFEEYLDFIENKLDIQLLDWQKVVLRAHCEGNPIYYHPSRGMGRDTVMHALKILEAIEADKSLSEFDHKENNYG